MPRAPYIAALLFALAAPAWAAPDWNKVDAALGRRDGQVVHELHALAAARWRAGEHLRLLPTRRRNGRKVRLAMQHLARDLEPVVQKRGLHLRHGGAAHQVVRVAPVVGVLRVARPRGRNAHASGKAHLPVHHQQFAVGAVVQAGQVVPVRLDRKSVV